MAFKNRIGEKYITNEGYEIQIIKYFNAKNCTIMFKDGQEIDNISFHQVKTGQIKNKEKFSVFGVGYLGKGYYKAGSYKYNTWIGILRRCYDFKYQERQPTYRDSLVIKEWHNFQNFAQWFEENYNPEIMEGWALDKDILLKGNKIYSPETCCFVPQEINNLFTKRQNKRGNNPIGVYLEKGTNKFKSQININKKKINLGRFNSPEEAFQAYKITKEQYIKQLADKWKDQIDPRVYQALYNYTVEITD